MQTIDMFLNRLSGDERASAQRDPEGPRGESLRAVRQQARGRFTALEERIAKIRTDPSRSPVGIQQAVAELVKKTDLAFLDSMRGEVESDLQRYRSLLFTIPPSSRSETLAFLSEQEIRRKYEDQPQHVIQKAYAEAMQRGDFERVRALTQGPLGSVVDADFQRRVEVEHAETSQPLVFENYQSAVNLKEHLDSLHDHAQQVLQALQEEAPVPARAGA